MNPFSHLNLDGVAVTAKITAGGLLQPIDGTFEKLVACVRSTAVPRIHTLVVAEGQREDLRRIDPKLLEDNPHAPLVVLLARDVMHMASLLAADAQTRWGKIENYSAELSRHRDFAGRGWMRELVDDFIAAAHGGHLLLVGQPGFGKSAFTADVVRRGRCDAFHFVKRGMGDWDDPGTILGSLSAQLRRRFTLPLAAGEEGRATAAVFNVLLHRVSGALAPGQKAVICLDGLDESFGPDGRFAQVALPGVLPHPLPENIKVILTSRPGEHLSWLAGEDHCRREDLDRNSVANLADIRGYFERQSASRKLGMETPLIDHLVTASEGCFAAAVLYLLDRPGLADRVAGWQKDPTTIPHGLDGWLTEEWKRLTTRGKGEPQRWPRFVKTVIGTMALAASPLSRDQLDVIFGTSRWRGKSISVDAALRKGVVDRLDQVLLRAEQFFDSGGVASSTLQYRFFHTRFPEFLKANLSFAEREACGTFLAAACASWQRVAAPMRDYVLRHGPRHLTEVKAWELLEALLTDLSFLEARAEAKLAFELGSDLDTAASSMPPDRQRQRILALLGEAVRRDVQFIDRHPTTLLQCLWNSCWWYDCDDAKHHYAPRQDDSEAARPWSEPGEKLCRLLEFWRRAKQSADPSWIWVRSTRPPAVHLGTAQRAVFRHEYAVFSASLSPEAARLPGA